MKLNELPGVARKRLGELNKNPAWLANQTNISRALVYAFISPRVQNPKMLSWENLEKLFAALGLELSIVVSDKKGGAKSRKTPPPPIMPV